MHVEKSTDNQEIFIHSWPTQNRIEYSNSILRKSWYLELKHLGMRFWVTPMDKP